MNNELAKTKIDERTGKAYLECLKKLRTFRKTLAKDIDKKRGKLYFT